MRSAFSWKKKRKKMSGLTSMLEPKHPLDKCCECFPDAQQRLTAYTVTFIFGTFLYACSYIYMWKIFNNIVTPYVIFFLAANLTQLSGSIILYGPVTFLKKMTGEQLRLAFFLYVASMGGLIASCYVSISGVLRVVLVILFSLSTYLSLLYVYVCSVPFAKKAFDKYFSKYCCCCKLNHDYEAVPLVEKPQEDDEVAA
jgi:hypothetical protein